MNHPVSPRETRDLRRDAAATAAGGPSAPAANVEDRISRWLDALLLQPGSAEAPVSIAIVHAAVDQHQRLLRVLQVPAVPPAPDEFSVLVDTIAGAIAADAEDLGGMQRYQLRAQSKGKEIGSTTVRYAMDLLPSAIDSEPPNQRGLVAASQRHTEAAFRMMIQNNGTLGALYERRLASQEDMVERCFGKMSEMIKLQEDLLRSKVEFETNAEERRHEREMEAAESAAKLERNAEIWRAGLQKLGDFLPVVLHHFTGGKVGKSAAQLQEEAAQSVLSMTDEQLEKLRATMDPAQFEALKAQIRAARAEAAPAKPTASAGEMPSERPTAPGAGSTGARLEGDARIGAAMTLKQKLLPLLVERQAAGQPIFDPSAEDDWPLFQLAKRLIISCTLEEFETMLAGLPEKERDAILAVAEFLKVGPRLAT